jgi:hypothetical protein
MPSYRLTPAEYELHLERAGEPDTESTMENIRAAEGEWIVDTSHGTASYDDGWYWIRTQNLRVAL